MRRAAQKQSSRELASAGATTRVQNAAVQVGSLRPAFSQHARRRSQHLQSSTPSRSTLDAADLSSRGSEPMAGCRRSRVIAPSALALFCSPQIKLTAPARELLSGTRPGFAEGKSIRSGVLTWRPCVFLSANARRSAPQTAGGGSGTRTFGPSREGVAWFSGGEVAAGRAPCAATDRLREYGKIDDILRL